MESQKFPPVSKEGLWLPEQYPNKQFLGSLARTSPPWGFLKYCVSSSIGETDSEFWCIPTGSLQMTAEITQLSAMDEDRFQSPFTLKLCLSPEVEAASLSVFCTAFKLLLSGVLYLLLLQVNNPYITFFYAQITCVVSVSSPDPDQYSRLPSKAEPKAKSLPGSCLCGNVILECRTRRPGNCMLKEGSMQG